MSALQLWLQNHNRRLTQDAIDEALMEYITHVEKQRDELLAALERAVQSIIVFRNEQTLALLCKLRASVGYLEMQQAMDDGKEIIASVKENSDGH